MNTLVAMFRNTTDAQAAVDSLVREGFDRDAISFVGRGEGHSEDAVNAGQGAAFGAASGGVIGALVGLGLLAIPGVGPVLAAGPLIAALTGGAIGAVAGAPTGGLVAGLVKTHYVDETDARVYAEGVRRGNTLVTLDVSDERQNRATSILNQYNPIDVHSEADHWRSSGWKDFDETAAPLSNEDITGYRAGATSAAAGALTGLPGVVPGIATNRNPDMPDSIADDIGVGNVVADPNNQRAVRVYKNNDLRNK